MAEMTKGGWRDNIPGMENLLENLNEPQIKAVTHESGPLLIVAGAGTGKTTVLTRRYAWLLKEKNLTTDDILALTFTEKAAQEMEDRVLQMLPNGAYDFWINTFHGFCQRILERHGLEIGIPNTFRILTDTDAWILLKRHLDELPLDHYRPLGNPVKFLHAIIRHISRAKDECIPPEKYLEFSQNAVLDEDSEIADGERKRLVELANVYAAYQKIMRDEGALDFGDIILETLRLFKERPAVLDKYRKQFKYIMVDEFQDTNWSQYELIKLLAGSVRNITVVGDDDQAIYKFRGASLANILQFKDDYPDAATVALINNYRSGQEILDTAYTVISNNNPHRLEISLADQGLSKKLAAHKGQCSNVKIEWFGNLEQEAEWVATDVNARHTPDLPWSQFAILVRSNDEALPFVDALARRNIPFKFFALRGLYFKPVIVDLMALLNLANNPTESTSAWRVLTLPCYKLPLSVLGEVSAYAQRKGCGVWESVKQVCYFMKDTEIANRLRSMIAQIEGLAETSRRENPLAVLHQAVNRTGYLKHVMGLPEREKIDAVHVLNEFVARIKRYEQSVHAPHLKEFMEELKMEIQSGEQGALHGDAESGPDVVRIMTIHASKGLEFDTVYLVSMVDQRFPTRERSDAIPLPDGLVQERLQEGDWHLQEERRLCYVAMTRAKHNLILTGASFYGGVRKKKPSVFLDESKLDMPANIQPDPVDVSKLLEPTQTKEEAIHLREIFPLKHRFSFTQLVAYKKCPMQYKFAHVYRIPILGAHQKSFGQSVHLALQEILKRHMERISAQQGDLFDVQRTTYNVQRSDSDTESPLLRKGESKGDFSVPLEEALDIYKESWIDEWYKSRQDHDRYFAEGKEAIKNIWAKWAKNPPKVKALEAESIWQVGEHSIKVKIDRIDEADGGVELLDYKTSEYKPDQKTDVVEREQLQLYQLATEGRGLKVKRLAYVFVRADAEQEIPLLEGEAKIKFEEDLLSRMNEILVSDFPATPSQHLCSYCDFKDICEYRK